MSVTPVRLLFVGCGAIATHHVRAVWRSSVRAEVVAAADPNAEAVQEFVRQLTALRGGPCECTVFSSLPEALSWGQFSAVVLMVPHHLHEPLTEQCLRAGKHVLLEKPVSHTLESCGRLVRVVEEHPELVCMLGENSQFWPEEKVHVNMGPTGTVCVCTRAICPPIRVRGGITLGSGHTTDMNGRVDGVNVDVVKAKELIAEGVIGEPYFAQANYWESMGGTELLDSTVRDQDNWRYDKARSGGGVLVDGATHWIRPLRLWLGEVEEVVGVVGYPNRLSKVESLAKVLLRFTSGKTATLFCHHTDIPMYPLPFFQIFGDKGEITIDGSFGGGISVRTQASPDGKHFGSLGGYTAAFAPQMEVFLKAVVGGKGLEEKYGVRVAMGEVLLAHAAYKSVESRRWEGVSMENLVASH